MTDRIVRDVVMTSDGGEYEYLLNEEQMVVLSMLADGEKAMAVRAEIVAIVKAWARGQFLPHADAPTLRSLYDTSFDPTELEPPEPSAPIEIAGGVSGLQRHLIKLAEANRGLDPAALRQMYDAHQVVIAVWQGENGPGFLTLKGVEYLLVSMARRKSGHR